MQRISVQSEDFDVGAEYRRLCSDAPGAGAVATFCGLVRDYHDAGSSDAVRELQLEHYPGMTERCIGECLGQAQQRWKLLAVRVIHRVGSLRPGEQIVFVGVASHHRADALQAASFIMDSLKSEAPLWKKQCSSSGEEWIDIRDSDREALSRWSAAAE